MSLLDPTGILTGLAVEAVLRGADGLWKFGRRRVHPSHDGPAPNVFPRPIPSLPPRCVLPREAARRLSACLENRDMKVILVDGPAGSGKRTLSASVIGRLAESPMAGLQPARVAHIDLTLEVWPDDLKALMASLDDSGSLAAGWDRSTTLEQRLRVVAQARFSEPTLLWLTHLDALERAGDGTWNGAIPALLADVNAYDNNLRLLLASRTVPEGLRALAPGTCERIRLPSGLPSPERELLLDALAGDCAPLRDLSASERAAFLDATHANPMLMGRVANALRMDDGETDWRALVTGDIAGDIRALWDSAFRRLNTRQQAVADALAVLAIPAPVPAIASLVEAENDDPALHAALSHLQREGLLEITESADGDTLFSLHPSDRTPALQSMDAHQQDALHDASARYYARLLAQYTEDARATTSYARFYRFEDPEWQGNLTEWLWHQARSPGNHSGHLELAHIFFGAFWWWDEYLEFPFVGALLKRWRETQIDQADRAFAAILEDFRTAYPRCSNPNRAGLRGWNAVLESLEALRSRLAIGDEPMDVATTAVSALTAYYLAEARQFRPLPAGTDRAAENAAALHLFHLAQIGFEALTEGAVRGHALGVEYDWAVPYVLARKASLLAETGRHQDATAAIRDGLDQLREAGSVPAGVRPTTLGDGDAAPADEADEDFEARVWLYRAAGDMYWSQGRHREAWGAYTLLAWNAFLFQGLPPPTDDYSVAVYTETTTHLTSRMKMLPEVEREREIAASRDFWAPWRAGEGEHWPGESFMPPPCRADDWKFVEAVKDLLKSHAARDRVSARKAQLPELFRETRTPSGDESSTEREARHDAPGLS